MHCLLDADGAFFWNKQAGNISIHIFRNPQQKIRSLKHRNALFVVIIFKVQRQLPRWSESLQLPKK